MLVRRWNPLRDWLGRGILAASGVSHGSSLCVGRLIGLVFISGVAAGSGSCSAGLTGTAGLRGAASGSSAASAQVSASFAARGVTFGASFGSGPLGGTFAAKGTTFSASSARGALGGTFALQGVAHGAARAAGGVSGVFLVSGYTFSASRGVAKLTGGGALQGIARGAGGAHGILGAIVPIYGITRGAARGFLSTLLPLPTLTIRPRVARDLDMPLFRPERIGAVFTPEVAGAINRMLQSVASVVQAVRQRFTRTEGLRDRFRAVSSGATDIAHGGPVRIVAGDADEVAVVAAAAAAPATLPCVGLADLGASATRDGLFEVVRFGILRGLDTSGYTLGDRLYVVAAGGLTTTAPALAQLAAIVVEVNATDGKLWVVPPSPMTTGSGATSSAAYLLLAPEGTLVNHRTLAVGGGLTFADGGPAGTYSLGIDNDGVTDARLRDSAGASVIGRAAAGAGNPGDIVAGADGDVLRRSAGALAFGAIPEASVTGLVADLAAKAPTSRQVATTHSLSGGGDLSADRTLSLVNDTATPGANQVYGTDGAGTRGWKADPTGGSGLTHPQVLARSLGA